MKKLQLATAVTALVLSTSANAAMITWDIVTTYSDLAGTITFDDTPISGLVDGALDTNDTHIYGATLTLASSVLGINYTNTDTLFQPLTNTYDNKHIDYAVDTNSNAGSISLLFSANSDQGSPAIGVSEYWLTVNGDSSYRWAFTDSDGVNGDTNIPPSTVPVPAAVWLFGSGLLGLVGMARRKKA